MSEADYRDLELRGQSPIIRAFACGWGATVILILALWHTQTAIAVLGGVTIALVVWAVRELT